MTKLRLRDVKWFAKDSTASKWLCQDSNQVWTVPVLVQQARVLPDSFV